MAPKKQDWDRAPVSSERAPDTVPSKALPPLNSFDKRSDGAPLGACRHCGGLRWWDNRPAKRIDLQAELDAGEQTVDLDALEKDFVSAAKGYSERKGISYAAWREVGVPASAVKAAGISRAV